MKYILKNVNLPDGMLLREPEIRKRKDVEDALDSVL